MKHFDIKPPPEKAYPMDWSDRIHPNLPKLPFFIGCIGPRKSGKTVLAYNMLDKKGIGSYGDVFKPENIIIYSPTLQFDTTLHSLGHIKHKYGADTAVDVLLASLVDQQKKFLDDNNVDELLIVLDDLTQVRKGWEKLENFGYIGRHYHIHIMYIAHKLSSVPRGVRTQTQQWFLYKPHEMSEFKWVLDTFANRETRQIWTDALKRAWSQQFSFAYLNFDEWNFDERYRLGLDMPLFTAEEKQQIDWTMSNNCKYSSKSDDEEELQKSDESM